MELIALLSPICKISFKQNTWDVFGMTKEFPANEGTWPPCLKALDLMNKTHATQIEQTPTIFNK
jgi:hypothetical protein